MINVHYMAVLPGVTRAAVGGGSGLTCASRPRWPRLVFPVLCASAMAAPTLAQPRPPGETTVLERRESDPVTAPSPASLQRIRSALAVAPQDVVPDGATLGFSERLWGVDQRPTIELLPDLAFVGGVDLFGDPARDNGPVPMGGPTHRDMLSSMTPRDLREAGSADVLGIATASAFALVPQAIKAVAGWFSGDDTDLPAHPILTQGEKARALATTRAGGLVLDAAMQQRGRTVALSLIVPPDMPPDTAHLLGERFVRLVKTLATSEPDPEGDIGPGDYDYIVSIHSPAHAMIARGGKATADTQIHW